LCPDQEKGKLAIDPIFLTTEIPTDRLARVRFSTTVPNRYELTCYDVDFLKEYLTREKDFYHKAAVVDPELMESIRTNPRGSFSEEKRLSLLEKLAGEQKREIAARGTLLLTNEIDQILQASNVPLPTGIEEPIDEEEHADSYFFGLGDAKDYYFPGAINEDEKHEIEDSAENALYVVKSAIKLDGLLVNDILSLQ
jgi:hypothetical protein